MNHIPVLLTEAIDALHVSPGVWYIDATFGRGGHTRALLEKGAHVLALDVDQTAIEFGKESFAEEVRQGKLILVRENFAQLATIVQKLQDEKKIGEVSGILFDFGTSSNQLKDAQRGFSFSDNGELDMRMDDRLGVKAKDLLALLSEKQLTHIFTELGGEHEAWRIARAIVARRQVKAIQTVAELVEVIEKTKRERRGHLHPATKVFQALRIAVNDELQSIELALPQAEKILQKGGYIVAMSFHEGEDRIVKHMLKKWEETGLGEVVTKKALSATEAEIAKNNRARSAKLRVYRKN